MIKNKKILFLLLLFSSVNIFSQNIIKDYVVEQGDTILLTEIPSIDIISFTNNKERWRYQILKRKVLKVYPYAIYTKQKLEEIENELYSISRKRKKKKHTKKVSKTHAKIMKTQYINPNNEVPV